MSEHDLTPAYAADAVSPAEREQAELHLASCPPCRAEVAVVREGLAALADAVAVEPPAHLRASVLARLADVPQLAALHTDEDAAPGGARDAAPDGRPAGSTAGAPRPSAVVDLGERRARRRRLPALVAAAAALVLLGGAALGWTAVQYRADRDAARAVAADLERVATAPDAVTVAASGGSQEEWSRTSLVVSVQEGTAVLVDTGARPAPDGRTYQLWLLREGDPEPAATFQARGEEAAVLHGDMGGVTGVAVTVEPEGGSTSPTTEPVAVYSMA